jgi:hypothetical protein
VPLGYSLALHDVPLGYSLALQEGSILSPM